MKTITEFTAMTLKNAAKTQADLQAAGKTAEEMPQALGEALKLEGDKLNHLLNALEAVGEKTGDLKRVIVMSLGEGEKAPSQAKQKGEHYFFAEYYPAMGKGGAAPRGFEHGGKGKDGKRGDRKGKGRGGERGGRGGERGGRGEPRRDGAPGGFPGASPGGPKGAGDRGSRGPRRQPGADQAGPKPAGAAPTITPKKPIAPIITPKT